VTEIEALEISLSEQRQGCLVCPIGARKCQWDVGDRDISSAGFSTQIILGTHNPTWENGIIEM
jgi:hypothetical protein